MQKRATAPGCALLTSLTSRGIEGRFTWSCDDEEALLESLISFNDETHFAEEGTILLAHGNALRIRGHGELEESPDPDLRQGSIVWRVVGGVGSFDGATGLITSSFFLSATGDLTENQLGVIFRSPPQPAA